jgi:plastocyanin domain-containing protein
MKRAIISLTICVVLAMGMAACSQAPTDRESTGTQRMMAQLPFENGRQVISITARGGYSPRDSFARADVPSIIRVVTKNTFDCSRALILPSLNVQKILPATGAVDFEVPLQKQGTQFYGICGMGMYSFRITFR